MPRQSQRLAEKQDVDKAPLKARLMVVASSTTERLTRLSQTFSLSKNKHILAVNHISSQTDPRVWIDSAPKQTLQTHAKAHLESLPTELLEQIALALTYPSSVSHGDHLQSKALNILRLTSRTIKSNIEHVWLHLRFSTWMTTFTNNGLADLAILANHPRWSQALKTLQVKQVDAHMHAYKRLISDLEYGRHGAHRGRIIAEKESMEEATPQSTFLEMSGTGTRLLVETLNKLPNIQRVEIQGGWPCSSLRYDSEEDDPRIPGSATVLFTCVLDAIATSNAELKALVMTDSHSGAAEDAFHVPDSHMERFSSLESVAIYCTRERYENPETHGSLSKFLGSLPKLKKLRVRLDAPSSRKHILKDVARLTHPDSVLREIHLDGLYLEPMQQDQLLIGHEDILKSLTFENCRLDGEENQWRKMFLRLSSFPALKYVEFNKLAENGVCVQFPSTAAVDEFDIHPADLDRWHLNGRIDDPDAWVLLSNATIYRFVATEWEDIPVRLNRLADDIKVSDFAPTRNLAVTRPWPSARWSSP